jgi:hypothetical protein
VLLQFGEQGFDFVPCSQRLLIGRRFRQRTNRLSRLFLPMNKQPPIGTSGTEHLLWTASALRFRRAIEITLLLHL